ncbi:hypothetical protein K2D_46570 (plasmid) [Planctomycetes bacterium K2D]|nr:hypothetical protein K2D_46570 [Planctomycetes bacterium K2D]
MVTRFFGETKMTNKKKTIDKPANEFRIGAIKATVWKNETVEGPRFNTKLSRIYRVAEEKREKNDSGWRDTDSLGRDDLLVAAKVMDLAHTWVEDQIQKSREK